MVTVLTALLLSVSQAIKLLGDYHTAYNSFAFLFLLPVFMAGIFCGRKLILLLSLAMGLFNITFFLSTFGIEEIIGDSRESIAIGFVSSTLILAIGAILLYLLRRIMDRAFEDIVANNRAMQRFVPFGFIRSLAQNDGDVLRPSKLHGLVRTEL